MGDLGVVFLHGVAGSRATYRWLPESVAGHRVIRPDFRGHGAAARTPGEYHKGEPDGHAGNAAIPHFRHLRSLVRAWQAEGVGEAEAAAQLAAEPDGDVQAADALAARAYALLHRQRDGGPPRIRASTSSTLPRHHPSFSMYQVRSV